MMRALDFELTPFAGGVTERVTVMAEHRAFGFSLAAAQAADPNNVWKVRLIRDNGKVLDPDDIDERNWDVPFGSDPQIYTTPDDMLPRTALRGCNTALRGYGLWFDLLGRCEATETPSVMGRVNAFTGGVIWSDTPNDVAEIRLYTINIDGDYYEEVDENKKYGGIVVDLDDPPHWIWSTTPFR